MVSNILEIRLAGYAYLLDLFELTVIPNWHRSSVSLNAAHHINIQNGIVDEVYPVKYWPGEKIGDHLEFALKYDGVNLGILKCIFETVPQTDIIDYIRSKPIGKYARKVWFFYEFVMRKQLPIDDITKGNYIEALESDLYHTIRSGENSKRHRVVNNLLGLNGFCPVIRKTDKLKMMDAVDWYDKAKSIVKAYPNDILRRVLKYLYNKEIKSSFEIEHIKPNASRSEKFIALLELAEKEDFCEKDSLVGLQNRIVDPRFRDKEYRTIQNYVGQTVTFQKEIIHFISPKPEDISELMDGLIETHERLKNGDVFPVIHATIVSYGFVFLHPFEDGNGRIHRFLIHNILSIQGMVPKGLMLPISAVMLKNPSDYNASLEAFSRPLLQLVDHELDEAGNMKVYNETACWYQYIDMTAQAEALYEFINKTISDELIEELNFLENYDKTKKEIQNIIDMPDHLIDLFIQLCLQNNGSLSERKRASHFKFLTDIELVQLERVIRDGYTRNI